MNRLPWEITRQLPVIRGSKQRQDKLQERRLRHGYVSRPEDTESFPNLGYLHFKIYLLLLCRVLRG